MPSYAHYLSTRYDSVKLLLTTHSVVLNLSTSIILIPMADYSIDRTTANNSRVTVNAVSNIDFEFIVWGESDDLIMKNIYHAMYII